MKKGGTVQEEFDRALNKNGLPQEDDTYTLDKIEFGEELGKGAFGLVSRGTFYPDGKRKKGETIAIKTIEKRKVARSGLLKQLALEILVHRSLISSNIIRFYGFQQDEDYVYFFIEHANQGDLVDYMSKHEPDERGVAEIMRRVGLAIEMCHDYGIVHRDLKPENILMNNDRPKLTDFGYCDKIGSDGYCKNDLRCGTIDFMSPEMINDEQCGYPVDVWAFGAIIYDLLVGQAPFYAQSKRETYWKIQNANLDWYHPKIANVKPLLRTIFIIDPFERATIEEVLASDWL